MRKTKRKEIKIESETIRKWLLAKDLCVCVHACLYFT